LWFTEAGTGAIGVVMLPPPRVIGPAIGGGDGTTAGAVGADSSTAGAVGGGSDPSGGSPSPTRPTVDAPPRAVTGEQVLSPGPGKHRRVVGFEFDFRLPLDA